MSGTGQKVCVRVVVVWWCKPIIVLSLYQAEQQGEFWYVYHVARLIFSFEFSKCLIGSRVQRVQAFNWFKTSIGSRLQIVQGLN